MMPAAARKGISLQSAKSTATRAQRPLIRSGKHAEFDYMTTAYPEKIQPQGAMKRGISTT
jgi:hypothetical protein